MNVSSYTVICDSCGRKSLSMLEHRQHECHPQPADIVVIPVLNPARAS